MAADGERLSGYHEKDRYDLIRAKMAGCVQDAEGPDLTNLEQGSKEWYSNSFNSSYQIAEQNSHWQIFHKAGGKFITATGNLTLSGSTASERNFYYGFEQYGEPWERWSRQDLIDDTEWERSPGRETDWRAKHNQGCKKYVYQ